MAQKAELKAKINLDSSGFSKGIEKAKSKVKNFARSITSGLLPVLGAAGAAGAFVKFGKSAIDSASQITQLSKVSGVGVEDFQKFAEAAKTVNIEQEKLADIFKDTSDKMGDFLQVGSGPMVDFFEKIAPKVGATKEEFIGLSGPEALQRYFDYLKKANLPHQDMVFYMEAIASDATMLIPLLEDGGEAFRTLGEGAAEAGRIMDKETIAALTEAKNNLERFEQRVTIFAGNIIGAIMPARDAIKELAKEQLIAEGKIRKIGRRKSTQETLKDNRLIKERKELLEKQAEDRKKAADEAAKDAAALALQEREAEEERKRLAKQKREEERKASKAARELEKAEREAERKAREAEIAAKEAKEKAAAKRISDATLKLLQAEAAQDDALTHEMRKQLELEQSIQDIMQSTNLDRAQAIKLARDLAKASAGPDTNQSGYTTPREQRAAERKQRKEDQARRKRERQERSAEIKADQEQRKRERDERFRQRERDSGFGPGAGTVKKDPKGTKSENQKESKESQQVAESSKETAENTKEILAEIKKNPS